jgi:hypothetical protein
VTPARSRAVRLPLIAVLVGLAVAAGGATGEGHAPRHDLAKTIVTSQDAWDASLITRVKPGETVAWRSRRIGTVTKISAVTNGWEMAYEPKPKTNNCVAFAYGQGIAVRLTDCVNGRRVRYVRVSAVNVGAKPARLTLRFATG